MPHTSSPRSLSRAPIALLAGLFVAALLMLASAPPASADGGVSPTGDNGRTVPGEKAKLRKGKAIAPESAPRRVKKVIRAANKIRKKPYKWGGGHGRWNDSGYDCSGAVSYALRGGKFIDQPMDSRGLARYGKKGKGSWITVFGADSHAYMIVAGLRFDTSMVKGDGPGWSKKKRSTPENYKKRHPKGY